MFSYITVVALLIAPVIAGPWTNATCVDDYWSFNTQGQSPCLIAAYLGAQCTTDNTFRVYSLSGDGPYSFAAAAASNCLCNSVVWNLISACALCQKASAGSWGQWVASCPNNLINVGKYPIPLPPNVAVPAWAYYDFTAAGAFNPITASQLTGRESSAVSSVSSTATATTGSTSTPQPISNQLQSNSNVNTGAIVGGVVGGILGLGLIALVVYFLIRRTKREEATNYPETSDKQPVTVQLNSTAPMAGYVSHQPSNSNQLAMTPEHKQYDPSDPSTFPTGPATPASGYYAEPLRYQSQPTPGQYTGAPEV
ncbi:hypothetical protein OPQ81_003981 [Rhizoctonia solani]|nr:hypothetical protein OPQ81_003981 [Rhizoctonia solani]